MNRNYRIKDIAELSGVSTGTVDRILHKRGKVSIEAREKVEKVLKEIDYHPNLIARSLALKKVYNLIAIIPNHQKGEYWDQLCKGIEAEEKNLFSYNVTVKRMYFDQYDVNSFNQLIPQIADADCQGVVIATLFRESVLTLTKRLDEKNIPYTLIDAFIEGTNSVAYYGTPSFDSGYIAGRLIFEQIRPEDDIVVFKVKRAGNQTSTQVLLREEGFRTYLNDKGYIGRIHQVLIYADDEARNKEIVNEFARNHPDVNRGIIFNSKAHLIGDYIPDAEKFRLVGYDATEANIKYLEDGRITHLIAQRPEVQGLNCIKSLFRHLVLKEKNEVINYMPIDILMKENVKYYNNYI